MEKLEKLDPDKERIRTTLDALVEKGDMDGLYAFVERLTFQDPLTGIPNRRGFIHDAELVFQRVARDTTALEQRADMQIDFSIAFLDIDHFKNINDTYGHDAGDAALKVVGRVLQGTLRGGDMIGRWGGEEFVVAFMGAKPIDQPAVGEKLRRALEAAEFTYQDQHIPLTASIGVAKYHNGEVLEDIIKRADGAMYQAKQSGRNRVIVA